MERGVLDAVGRRPRERGQRCRPRPDRLERQHGLAPLAGGDFTGAGLAAAARVARFNAADGWSDIGGAETTVRAFANFSPGVYQSLYILGDFRNGGGIGSAYTAAYSGCAEACPPDFDHSGEVNANDISAYLNGWYADLVAGATRADYNHDGETNANDVSAFLNEWYAAIVNGGACS